MNKITLSEKLAQYDPEKTFGFAENIQIAIRCLKEETRDIEETLYTTEERWATLLNDLVFDNDDNDPEAEFSVYDVLSQFASDLWTEEGSTAEGSNTNNSVVNGLVVRIGMMTEDAEDDEVIVLDDEVLLDTLVDEEVEEEETVEDRYRRLTPSMTPPSEGSDPRVVGRVGSLASAEDLARNRERFRYLRSAQVTGGRSKDPYLDMKSESVDQFFSNHTSETPDTSDSFSIEPESLKTELALSSESLVNLMQGLIREGIVSVALPSIVSRINSPTPEESGYDFKLEGIHQTEDGSFRLSFNLHPSEEKRSDVRVGGSLDQALEDFWPREPDISREFGTTPTLSFNPRTDLPYTQGD